MHTGGERDPLPESGVRLRWAKIAIWLLAGLCLGGALALIWTSTMPFEGIKARVLPSIPPGYEDRFTFEFFSKLTFGMRLLGGLLCVCGVGLAVLAERLSVVLDRLVFEVATFGKYLWSDATAIGSHYLACLAVLLWAVGLRLFFVHEPVRNDEAYTFMHYASRPLFIGLTYYTANNHLLNTLLIHWATTLFGASLIAIRLPAMAAGILLVPATYFAVRLYEGRDAGLIAAALVSASSPLVSYSFNARGYSLGAFFLVAMIGLVGFAISRQSVGAWLCVPMAAALALYSVPTMLYGVGGVFVCLLLARYYRPAIWGGFAAAVITLVLYAPALAAVGLSAISSNQWTAPISRAEWPGQFAREMASLWRYANVDLPVLVSAVVVVGFVYALISQRKLRLGPTTIFLSIALVALILMPIQRIVPPRRTWLFILPIYFSMAAAGLAALAQNAKHAQRIVSIVTIVLAGWMGSRILSTKGFRHTGLESLGPRSVGPIVLSNWHYLLQGAQFISHNNSDSGLDLEMFLHGIPYRPSRTGKLLIVTATGEPYQETLKQAGIEPSDVLAVQEIGQYEDADVYLGERGPELPFIPRGTTAMGVFTQADK